MKNLEKNIQWLMHWGENEHYQRGFELAKNTPHIDSIAYYSGGGHTHLFLHLANKKVLSFHFCEFVVELSYKEWDSLEDYMEGKQDDGDGFGFEYDYPNWEERHLDINWTTEDYNKLLKL
jgi:hypothetical protein